MNNKIFSKLDTAKKKVGAIVLSTVLLGTLAVGTVYAASSMNPLQVKTENGVQRYSTDGGKTWSQNAPEGVTVSDKDGKLTITNGIPPKDGEGDGMLSKMENGVRYYSIDGGKTWSQNAPEGVTVNEDGSVVANYN
ncbi:MAG: sialidase family protein [Thermoanaerobacterium sp.]|nr:sialidase family protein [Thermoanaerobacterium sp.]